MNMRNWKKTIVNGIAALVMTQSFVLLMGFMAIELC